LMMVDSVSISITSAIVYGVSGGLFFLLFCWFLLVCAIVTVTIINAARRKRGKMGAELQLLKQLFHPQQPQNLGKMVGLMEVQLVLTKI